LGKQKLLPHTTRAEKRRAATDALAAVKAAADASKVLLPDPIQTSAVVPEDAKPAKKRRRKKSPEPTPAPAPAAKPEPAVVKIPRKTKTKREEDPPAEVVVQNTPGPDNQPKKKLRKTKIPDSPKTGKPEEGSTKQPRPATPKPEPATDKPKITIEIIESPGKVEIPKLITAVRTAVKADALDKDLMRKYLNIGLQMNEDEDKIQRKLSKEDEDTLKEIYKEGVWKKAMPNRSGGGGRMAPTY
jgi:hypothetical protein